MRKHSTRMWMGVFMLALPLAARPEGKCGDDPVPEGPGGTLVVTWAIPYPKEGLARFAGTSVFEALDAQLGPTFPTDYDGPKDATAVNLYPDVELADVDSVVAWELKYKIKVPENTRTVLARFVPQSAKGKAPKAKRLYSIRGALVEHPPLQDPTGWNICTCIFQRGVVIFDRGQEDLWVRTVFRTKKGTDTRAFVPRDGWWFSFRSEEIWFPMAFNQLQPEKSWMVLDILSPVPFRTDAQWGRFQRGVRAPTTVTLFGKTYYAVRVQLAFDPGTPVDDMAIDPKLVLR